MAAEMTRLPTFYDLKIGALAENGIREDTKERKRRLDSILAKRVTAASLKKNQQLYWGEVKRIHKGKLNKRLHLWGLFLLSSFLIYFILELLF